MTLWGRQNPVSSRLLQPFQKIYSGLLWVAHQVIQSKDGLLTATGVDGLEGPHFFSPDIRSKGVPVEIGAAETDASCPPWFLPPTAAVWQTSRLSYSCFRIYQTLLMSGLVLRKKPNIPICRLLYLTPEVCFWPGLISGLCCPTGQILSFVRLSGKEGEGVFE